MAGPVKRSVMIAGHSTSLSLEPIFWDALAAAAVEEAVPLNGLVARIDAARAAEATPPNLASAVRVWLFERALQSNDNVPHSKLTCVRPDTWFDNENNSQ